MKRILAAGALLLALAGVGAWWYAGRASTERGASEDAVALDAVASATGRRPAAGVQDAAAALRQRLSTLSGRSPGSAARDKRVMAAIWAKVPSGKWWLPPFDEVYADMRAAAERGDLEAAYVLGSRSAQCRKTVEDDTPEKMLIELDRLTEEEPAGPGDQARINNIHEELARNLAEYEACSAVGRASLDESLQWLERAGRGGFKDARLSYVAAWSEQTGRDRDALIADIERAAAQRTLAREWLGRGLAAGDERALDLYIDAYSGRGGLFSRDRVQALAYGYARDLVRSRRVGQFDALWASGPSRFGELTSPQWDAAETQGRALFKAHYAVRPAWPNGAPSP